jgi:hypothetical protein
MSGPVWQHHDLTSESSYVDVAIYWLYISHTLPIRNDRFLQFETRYWAGPSYLEKIGPVDLTGVSTWDAENSKTDPIPPLTLEKI